MFLSFYEILFCVGCAAVVANANHFSMTTFATKLFLSANNISAKISIYSNKLYETSPIVKYWSDCFNKYSHILYSILFQFYIEPKQQVWSSFSSYIHQNVSISETSKNLFSMLFFIIYDKPNHYSEEYHFCDVLENTIDKNNLSEEMSNMFIEQCSQRKQLLEGKTDCHEENITIKYFDKYIVKNIRKNSESEPIVLKKSDVFFLTVQYTNPKMKTQVTLEIPKGMYMVGNELFSPSFVLRLLNYQPTYYVFDYDYVLKIVDSNVNIIELNRNQYIKLNETTYDIKNVNLS